MRRRFILFAVAALVATALPIAAAGAHEGPDLTPADVTENVALGGSFDVEKTVHTPPIPPIVDICLVEDETGSFANDIANLQALIPDLITELDNTGSNYATCVIGFRDFDQNGWGSPNDHVYRLLADVQLGGAGFTAGAAGLSASGGNDGPEAQLEALHYMADPAHAAIDSNGDGDTVDANDTPAGLSPTWRAGAVRVALLTTDNTCHVTNDAGGWPGDAGTASFAATAAALSGASITVIGLTPGGAGTIGCVDTLAAGTGGTVHATTSSGIDIVDAILAGLGNLPVTVSMATDCAAPIGVSFAPAAQVVTSGDHAVFTETITVAGNAAPGVHECDDWAVVDGVSMVNAAGAVIKEHKKITVVTATCDPTENPHGKTQPVAPGKGGQGQNQDGFYEIGSDPAGFSVFVIDDGTGTAFGPFPDGTKIKYVEDDTVPPSSSAMGSNNAAGGSGGQGLDTDVQIIGHGDALVVFVDGFGNVSPAVSCLVPPPPK